MRAIAPESSIIITEQTEIQLCGQADNISSTEGWSLGYSDKPTRGLCVCEWIGGLSLADPRSHRMKTAACSAQKTFSRWAAARIPHYHHKPPKHTRTLSEREERKHDAPLNLHICQRQIQSDLHCIDSDNTYFILISSCVSWESNPWPMMAFVWATENKTASFITQTHMKTHSPQTICDQIQCSRRAKQQNP